ncbi:hypothetical protein GCM10007968_04180 [Sporolactobacillus putidus]|uniref:Uncharacterized protein n=1 Tax=Sporolactobacillus putidus TaxID=492735 RepID=A0A917RX47_9BACL|nr:hypothetical protein GCM10007968_04180 [Sporolactobacillus putidus]
MGDCRTGTLSVSNYGLEGCFCRDFKAVRAADLEFKPKGLLKKKLRFRDHNDFNILKHRRSGAVRPFLAKIWRNGP